MTSDHPSEIAILLLAAGQSSRMRGRDKLMEEVDGAPLLSTMVQRAQETGGPVFVTLPGMEHERAALIGSAMPVLVPDAAEGMAASVRRGVAALPPHITAVIILPTDMPELTGEDFQAVLGAFSSENPAIVRGASADGHPGHPVLFPQHCFEDLKALSGDQGARALLKSGKYPVRLVPLPEEHALTDLDTPEAWARWRAQQKV
jgi:CTP:molybdopterin cytidylyltransferase MocA